MRARSSLSEVQREQLVELFEQGMGCRAAARVVGVSRDATRRLYRRFQLRGRLCLVEKPNKQHYSFEAKKEVVERHLAGESMMDLAREFNGPDPRKVDTSGVSYAAWVSVADVSASKSLGARRLHQECRLRVL